ncbi:MAG: TIGR03086 family metal-binding protein [Micropruina sp.]|uniref:TIGR03086 family metal-binding protein n=1 Tax=Micropruina sp. TaxID=2737536 RepID=UPI0039E364F9
MTETQKLPDTRPLFHIALTQIGPLIDGVTVADLDRPTPCSEWTVRELLSHLIAVENRIMHIAGGGKPFEVPSVVEGIADAHWSDAWHSRIAPLEQSLADDALLGREWAHPAGAMPGFQAIAIYASELAVHAWDLARSLGRDAELNQNVAAAVVGPMTGALPPEPRGAEIGIPFGPVVPVADDAPPYARLVGWVGRDPEWTPAS